MGARNVLNSGENALFGPDAWRATEGHQLERMGIAEARAYLGPGQETRQTHQGHFPGSRQCCGGPGAGQGQGQGASSPLGTARAVPLFRQLPGAQMKGHFK